jgi:hypothetical protein
LSQSDIVYGVPSEKVPLLSECPMHDTNTPQVSARVTHDVARERTAMLVLRLPAQVVMADSPQQAEAQHCSDGEEEPPGREEHDNEDRDAAQLDGSFGDLPTAVGHAIEPVLKAGSCVIPQVPASLRE